LTCVVPRHIGWSKQQHQLVKSKKKLHGERTQSIKILIAFWCIVYVGIIVSRRNCRRFGPARTLNRPVNLMLRVPAQMGRCKMEHEREDEAYVILHRGARSRGYKRRERERERESLALR
jgi:hypothetical protein